MTQYSGDSSEIRDASNEDRDSQPDTDLSSLDAGQDTSVFSGGSRESASAQELPFTHLGHYEITGRIGHGGMGDVYKGFEKSLNRQVAIKVLPADFAQQEDFVRRFYAEASAAAKIVHPHIIPIHFIGEDQGCHFFAMQYVEGESLAQLLARRGKLSVDESLDLLAQVLSGLKAAHQHGLIHRDIKPANILLDRVHQRAVIADFGLVKSLQEEQTNTATGVVMGTVDYISPEQGRGQTVDHRSDLYSLGVLLYQLLSGKLPFTAESPTALIFQHVYERPQPLREINKDVPEALSAVVAKLMAKSPEDRHASARAVLDDLQAIRTGEPLPSRADVALRSDPSAFSRLSDRSGPPQSLVITAPKFDDDPWLPEEIPEETTPSWWQRIKARLGAAAHRHAPELVEHWANTQQQVDLAVAEYQRRQQRLAELVHEADEVLNELRAREAEWRDVSNESQDTAFRTAEELHEAIEAQDNQLASMRLNLAKINAMLETLKSQRDILQARLRAARPQRSTGTILRTPSWVRLSVKWITVALIVLVSATVISNGVLIWQEHQERLKNPPASRSTSTSENAPFDVKSISRATCLFETVIDPQSLSEFTIVGPEVNDLRLLSQSRMVVVARSNGVVEVFDSQGGNLLNSISTELRRPNGLVFSRTGQIAEVSKSSNGHSLRIWDPRGGAESFEFGLPYSEVIPLDLDELQRTLLILEAGDTGGTISRLNLDDPSLPQTTVSHLPISELHASAIQRSQEWAAFATSEKIFVRGFGNPRVADVEFDSPGVVVSLACHPKDDLLAIGCEDGIGFLYDLNKQAVTATLSGHQSAVTRIEFDRTGRRLATSSDESVLVWDVALHFVRQKLAVKGASGISFSEDGTRLAANTHGGKIVQVDTSFPTLKINVDEWLGLKSYVFSSNQLAEISQKLMSIDEYDPRRAVSKDDKFVIIADSGVPPFLKAVSTDEVLVQYGEDLHSLCVAISPDNQFFASGSYDSDLSMGDVRLLNLRSGTEVKKFYGHVHYAWSVAFSPNGKLLASGGKQTLHVWDINSGKEIHRFLIPDTTSVERVAFSPDGRWGMGGRTTGERQLCCYFDLESGAQLMLVEGTSLSPSLPFEKRENVFDSRYGAWTNSKNR